MSLRVKFKETDMKNNRCVLAMPAVAQSRGDWQRNNDNDRRETRSSVTRSSGAARHASGSRHVAVARKSYVRSRLNDFRLGVAISLGGVFRDGEIYVDAVNSPGGGYGYDDGYGTTRGSIRGVVDRVDYRTGIVWLRDDGSGRLIEADLRDAGRYSRIDRRDLRRGDRVELSGEWMRGNSFAVDQVDRIRTRR